MSQCPNVLPGAACVDPDCSFCRIEAAEAPPAKIVHCPLDDAANPSAWHWCPACEMLHPIPNNGGWIRSGSVIAPTYHPSFLQHTKRGACHYFIRDGQLVFQGDCFHRHAGATVEMPSIPKRVMADLVEEIFRSH